MQWQNNSSPTCEMSVRHSSQPLESGGLYRGNLLQTMCQEAQTTMSLPSIKISVVMKESNSACLSRLLLPSSPSKFRNAYLVAKGIPGAVRRLETPILGTPRLKAHVSCPLNPDGLASPLNNLCILRQVGACCLPQADQPGGLAAGWTLETYMPASQQSPELCAGPFSEVTLCKHKQSISPRHTADVRSW